MYKLKYLIFLVAVVFLSLEPRSASALKDLCPLEMPPGGPSNGSDVTDQVPTFFPKESSDGSGEYTGEITSTTYESANLGRTASPAGNSYTTHFGGRRPLHGKTQCKPEDDEGHGVYKNRDDVANGRGDAIDITPSGGKAIAAFDGTAYPNYGSRDASSGSERSGGVRLVSKDKRVVAYYYHTFPMVRSGQEVSAGTAIARTGADGIGHIHFELLVDGKSVHGSSSLCGQPEQYVRSLWANMKKVLGIGV